MTLLTNDLVRLDDNSHPRGDREIGRLCYVSHEFVRQLRQAHLSTLIDSDVKSVTRGGTTYLQNQQHRQADGSGSPPSCDRSQDAAARLTVRHPVYMGNVACFWECARPASISTWAASIAAALHSFFISREITARIRHLK
jgi:hypothetical protein